jgi:hypothetical protein
MQKTRKEMKNEKPVIILIGTRGHGKKKDKGRSFCTYRPFFFRWRSKGTEDGLELIHVAFSWEIWGAKHQFRKDAADGPNVNGSTVVAATKQQFRRSIPSGRHKHMHVKRKPAKTSQDNPK